MLPLNLILNYGRLGQRSGVMEGLPNPTCRGRPEEKIKSHSFSLFSLSHSRCPCNLIVISILGSESNTRDINKERRVKFDGALSPGRTWLDGVSRNSRVSFGAARVGPGLEVYPDPPGVWLQTKTSRKTKGGATRRSTRNQQVKTRNRGVGEKLLPPNPAPRKEAVEDHTSIWESGRHTGTPQPILETGNTLSIV